MLGALANAVARHALAVIAASALAAAAAVWFGGGALDELAPYGLDDPDSESTVAAEAARRALGYNPTPGLLVLVDAGADVEESRAAFRLVDRVANRVFREPAVAWVNTYFTAGERDLLSEDGRSTYLVAYMRDVPVEERSDAAETLREHFADDPRISFTGPSAAGLDAERTADDDLRRGELIAFPLLLLLSFWFFRGVVAALVPVLVGALVIVGALALIRVAAELTTISVFAVNAILGIGLALAVDYSLLIVSRYREEAARLGFGAEALRATMSSAGRTVLFSSTAILIAMASLLIFPQRIIYSLAVGGLLVALVAAAVTLIFTPALLALLGPRLDSLSRPRLPRQEHGGSSRGGGWYRFATATMKRPRSIALACGLGLLALGLPFADARFVTEAISDARVLPAGSPSRATAERIEAEFAGDPARPMVLVVEAPRPEAAELASRVAALEGVAEVAEPAGVGSGTSLISIQAEPEGGTDESEELIERIRAIDIGRPTALGGPAVAFEDSQASLLAHLPLAGGLLLLGTLFLLFVMTRSLILPLKAVLMNALSLAAAAGALVLIFQEGHLEWLLDFESPGALELTLPVAVFAFGFALSTDYGVFLLARIKEEHERGASNRDSVALGLEGTGRVVTAAALMVAVAIGAFAASDFVFVKALGIGLVLAVLIDATIVRALLVPALMVMLGRWNWWAPRPLERFHDLLTGGPPALPGAAPAGPPES